MSVKKVLNLYVCSKFSEGILELTNTDERITFVHDQNRPWLWTAHFFFQEIIIVVCCDLPLDPAYYNWLMFAPASTQKWRGFIKMALKEGRRDIIEIARKLRPKELKDMEINVEEILRQLPPEELERIDRDRLEAMEMELAYRAANKPEDLESALANLEQNLSAKQLKRLSDLWAVQAEAKS